MADPVEHVARLLCAEALGTVDLNDPRIDAQWERWRVDAILMMGRGPEPVRSNVEIPDWSDDQCARTHL